MKIKLLLSGISLLSLLAACSDRNEEFPSTPEQSKNFQFSKTSKENTETAKTETAKIVTDSLKTQEIINATQGIPTPLNADGTSQNGGADSGETIDPTKPDRPK